MAILKTFLCVFNTRTGSLISGCYTLVISLACLVYYLFRYVGHKLIEDSAEYKGIIYVGFVLYGFMIVSSLVIIPGVQLDKRYLLLPWIYIIILVVLYDTGSVALLTTVHMEREKTLHIWEVIWLFFYLVRLGANCYSFTCVVSQYQELSDGRGTYDYLYKPRRRARLRDHSQFDIDTYSLPFGVHLPPYKEEDDSANSPPTYEQIYPIPSSNSQGCNSIYADIEINCQTTHQNRNADIEINCQTTQQNRNADIEINCQTTQQHINPDTETCCQLILQERQADININCHHSMAHNTDADIDINCQSVGQNRNADINKNSQSIFKNRNADINSDSSSAAEHRFGCENRHEHTCEHSTHIQCDQNSHQTSDIDVLNICADNGIAGLQVYNNPQRSNCELYECYCHGNRHCYEVTVNVEWI